MTSLTEVLEEVYRLDYAEFDNPPNHRFSRRSRKRLKEILYPKSEARYQRRMRPSRRVAITLIIIAFMAVGATAFAAVNLGRYGFVDKREYSKLFVENNSSDKTRFEEYYGLSEEDGWRLTNYDIIDCLTLLNYERGEEKVTFGQNIIQENMGNVNTENAEIEPMSIYEENDGFFIEFQNGRCGLWWIYDGYLLSIGGDLNKSELVNLAHSTKIVDL